jgi:hypothetical protein
MRARIGVSVMPLETRREAIISLATEADRLGVRISRPPRSRSRWTLSARC